MMDRYEVKNKDNLDTKEHTGLFCNMIFLRALCMFVLAVQALTTILIFRSIFIHGTKKMILMGPLQSFLRMSFMFIIWFCVANDVAVIHQQGAFVYREMNCLRAFWSIFCCATRLCISFFIYFTVCVFILTTESNDPENFISLATKFSALLIVIRLDEIVLGNFFNTLGDHPAFDDVPEPT
jgi:hypothetical protein